MKVLIVGSGGREHAICQHLSQSYLVKKIFVAPGNMGMKETLPDLIIENIHAENIEGLLQFALKENIDLTIVGPEVSLAAGVVDLFLANGLFILGPSKEASQLETSKIFAKKKMLEWNIPTASYEEFNRVEDAINFLDKSHERPMVVKCDGLASGKGVIVCRNKNEARIAVLNLMTEKFLGMNVDKIIIEEFLEGIEVSAFALCDGENFSFLGTACDHKRLKENDLGPNTGGMGTFSPAPFLNATDEIYICNKIFAPVLDGMKNLGIPFRGILFAGLMKTKDGYQVLEFNVRFGDPEAQVLLPLVDEDLTPWFIAAAEGRLDTITKKLQKNSPKMKNKKAIHVVMAAAGYPGTEGENIRTGDAIYFSPHFELSDEDFLFMAGVEKKHDVLRTKGGRILGISSIGNTFKDARKRAYEHISKIYFEGAQWRNDIGREAFDEQN